MDELKQQAKYISEFLPKITRNLRIAPLIDEVKPGLTTSQLMVLLILKEAKDTALPVGKLTQELAVSFPSVSGIVDRLHKEKLIKRFYSKQDRRLVLLKLTTTGSEIVEKLINAFEELIYAVLKEMPISEQKSISKAIENVFTFSTILSKSFPQ